jgi:5'-deoxynucleotidase YfbR-like HD superfamily hydrolase
MTAVAFRGKFNIANPKAEDVDFAVIAHGLSQICRFGGQTKPFFSVAEHSLRLWEAVERRGGDEVAQLQALLHDAHEAFTGDMTRQLQIEMGKMDAKSIAVVNSVKNRIDRAIFEAAEVSQTLDPLVCLLDDQCGDMEYWLYVSDCSKEFRAEICNEVVETYMRRGGETLTSSEAAQSWLGALVELMTPPCG